MSASRVLDDLARTLAQPMPRRRALRVLGSSLVAVAAPGIRAAPVDARVTRSTTCDGDENKIQCQDTFGNFFWCCEKRKHITCAPTPGDCIDYCTGPGKIPCGSGAGFDCCDDPFLDQSVECKNGKCQVTCKGVEKSGSIRLTECGDECCTPAQQCQSGKCVPKCPTGRERCGGTCCKSGQKCRRGKCCPTARVCGPNHCCAEGSDCCVNTRVGTGSSSRFVCCKPPNVCEAGICRCPNGRESCGGTDCCPERSCKPCFDCGSRPEFDCERTYTRRCCGNGPCCGDRCCARGSTCCHSTCCRHNCARSRGRDVCCPPNRTVVLQGDTHVCCPAGTVRTRQEGCCPSGQPNCCPPSDGAGNVLDCGRGGKICVRGRCVNP